MLILLPRLLPEAGDRRHQPRRQGHADEHRSNDRPGPDRPHLEAASEPRHTGDGRRELPAAAPGLQGARADPDPARRRAGRRAHRGVRAALRRAGRPGRASALPRSDRRARVRDPAGAPASRRPPAARSPRAARSRSTARRCSCRARSSCSAIVALLLVAERSLERGGAFVASAAVTAGTEADRRAGGAGAGGNTDVYPLMMFSLGGMLLFVSANDLLTMFVALEVFSLPLYLLCALARRRRLLSQEAAMKYFLLGAFASAFFLFGIALIYGFASAVDFAGIHDAIARVGEQPDAADRRLRPDRDRPAVQGRGGAVPRVDAGRLPGRADAGHRVHGRLHEGRRVRWPAARAVRRVRPAPVGLQGRHRRDRGADDAGRLDPRGHADRHQAPARLLVHRERRLPAGRRAGVQPGRAQLDDVLPGRVRLHGDRRVRRRHAGARRRRRGDAPVPLGRSRPALAAVRRRSSRS